MKKKINLILLLLFFVFVVAVSWYSGAKYSFLEKKSVINKEIVVEQVKSVLKLGTVEGYFSEIYDFKEHYGFDISPFQKKALIRIKAKVLVGFNLDSLVLKVDDLSKTIIISGLNQPVLLSIDHDLDYYDITEGTFNAFTTDDYNKMNNQAKLFIKNTALKSDLFDKAEKQLSEHLNLLNILLDAHGWKLHVVGKGLLKD